MYNQYISRFKEINARFHTSVKTRMRVLVLLGIKNTYESIS